VRAWRARGREPPLAGTEGTRPGLHASAVVARRGRRLQLEARPFWKKLDGGTAAPHAWDAELGAGPNEAAGALLQAGLVHERDPWRAEVRTAGAWSPLVHGADTGWPEHDVRAQASVSRRLFRGDLVATLLTDWSGASERRLDGARLAPFVAGDVTLDVLLLRRAYVFWSVRDVADARPDLGPGVRGEGRYSFLGVRLRLLD
jgi:hypothetical protein